jgi:uncharacterized protein YjbI with pentapeptide repeats
MELSKILDSFARGDINKDKARDLIHAAYGKASAKFHEIREQGEKEFDSADSAGQSFRKAFRKIKESKNIDEFLKVSSGIAHQIAEKMPGEIEKLQENVLNDMSIAGFSANIKGVASKFTIFRNFEVEPECAVAENLAVGSQWFAVTFSGKAEVLRNKLTAVQLSEVVVAQSNFCGNNLALSRISNVTLQQARMEDNKLSRSTLSDASLTESDFTGNKLTKSEFAQTVFNASRIANSQFSGASFRECDFDACNIEGIEFENCHFEECSFNGVEILLPEPKKISGCSVVGKTFQNCHSFDAFLKLIDKPASQAHEADVSEKSAPVSEEVKVPASKSSESQAHVKAEPRPQHPSQRAGKPMQAKAKEEPKEKHSNNSFQHAPRTSSSRPRQR